MSNEELREKFWQYGEFVDAVTSDESKDLTAFMRAVGKLTEAGVNVPRLITGSIGLASESGELSEITKKMLFQGKVYNEDELFHMKRELGDILWYWQQCCLALGLDPVDVMEENVHKLEKRYPGGKFDEFFSENRQKGDL